jgi:predicted small lipoprotein YifL
VTSWSHGSSGRIAAIGAALVLAFGLTGCGRKGGLDPPPAAAIAQPGPGQQAPQSARVDAQGHPVAPATKRNEPFFLDWLLN